MATRLSSTCLARFQALPHTPDSSDAHEKEQQSHARLNLFLNLLAGWEPGLLDMVALIVLDQYEYTWIPPTPPYCLVGRAVSRFSYAENHIDDEWEPPDNEWCTYCQEWCEYLEDNMCGRCAYYKNLYL